MSTRCSPCTGSEQLLVRNSRAPSISLPWAIYMRSSAATGFVLAGWGGAEP